ncbi:MAG: hypothetical protein LBU42_03355 [Prevotellaceae bacterium]|jgi:hypothetical protein|nr:hypothetical protein [Prevotellaceae bacterium]
MKTILKFTAILLVLEGVIACGKDKEKEKESPIEKDGIIPSSIAQVVDVFELKYGEEKEWYYKDQMVKFTLTDVADNLMNCSVIYVLPEYQEEFFKHTRMFAYLRIETNNQSVQLKVSSQSCCVYEYKNDDTDIQDVWDMLRSWPIREMGHSLFKEQFSWALGTGTLLENISCSIYMVKADPIAYISGYNVKKSQYKFIFTITEN